MNFRWVTIEGFRSFRERHQFDFRYLDGLTHLAGENGAGKSSVMEAVYWCLYGKTSRGVKAGNVRTWRTKVPCVVTLRLEKDAITHDVKRSWNPNALVADGHPTTQEEIEQIVGLNEDEFLHAIYHAQFAPSFLDLLPTAQLALYSSVMQLERWERASDRAAKAAKDLDAEIAALERDVERDKGRLTEIAVKVVELRREEREWNRAHAGRLAGAEKRLKELKHG